jgi:hypothetical protein
MVENLVTLAAQADIGRQTREQLNAEILKGLEIKPCVPPGYDLDQGGKAYFEVCVTHNQAPAPNFPIGVLVPSGFEIPAVTGPDGTARVTLPAPAHSGHYPVVVRSHVESLPAWNRTISYQVTGSRETISDGRFHKFIEAQATGSTNKVYKNRHQAEEVALQTARQLAFARLLQMRQGLNMNAQTRLDGLRMTRNRVYSESAGHVDAQAVEEKIDLDGSTPVATVIYRMAL